MVFFSCFLGVSADCRFDQNVAGGIRSLALPARFSIHRVGDNSLNLGGGGPLAGARSYGDAERQRAGGLRGGGHGRQAFATFRSSVGARFSVIGAKRNGRHARGYTRNGNRGKMPHLLFGGGERCPRPTSALEKGHALGSCGGRGIFFTVSIIAGAGFGSLDRRRAQLSPCSQNFS